jgi:hypothetical protein
MRPLASLWSSVARLRSWGRATVRRSRLESEMEIELAHHVEARTADLIRSGYTPDDAARCARVELGPTLMPKEEMRASLGLRWVDEANGDLRYAARMLRKSPGFTAIAATSLALAIGANTTIFSVMKRVLLDRLDVPQPEQLRLLHWRGDKHTAVSNVWGVTDNIPDGLGAASFSYPVFEQLRHDNRVLEDLFAFKDVGRMNATIDGSAQILQGELVSGNYFEQLRIRPQLGRPILTSDDNIGAQPVALASAALWQRAFGSSPSVVGRTIKVNMVPVTIIGVTPPGFTGAKSVQAAPDIFFPMSTQPLVEPREKRIAPWRIEPRHVVAQHYGSCQAWCIRCAGPGRLECLAGRSC